MKREGKAALIVKTIPRDKLLKLLAEKDVAVDRSTESVAARSDASTPTAKCTATVKSGKRKGAQCGAPLPCKSHRREQPKWHLNIPKRVPKLWDAIYARFVLDDGPPSKRRKDEMMAEPSPPKPQWHLMATPPLPTLWNPIYERFSKREEKCGWTTHRGTPCQWLMPCPVHAEKRREHEARKTKGICGASLRCGRGLCQNVRGECRFHAPEDVRCMSTLETQPNERCYNWKVDGADYCDKHVDYPNLGARLRA